LHSRQARLLLLLLLVLQRTYPYLFESNTSCCAS
jgi:hypothetical protein